MPLHIECKSCHVSAYVDCELTPGQMTCDRPLCGHRDPDAAFDAQTVCKCCPEDHHHGNAASACTGGHAACPTPDNCELWISRQSHKDDSPERDLSAGPCPGGHCGAGVDGCTVCRPLTITVMPGSVTLRRAV